MNASSGPTTVGPDTTRMAPVISAAFSDMPSSHAASAAALANVINTPMLTRRRITWCSRPRNIPRRSDRPAS
jgi:hypothetical protein